MKHITTHPATAALPHNTPDLPQAGYILASVLMPYLAACLLLAFQA
ncbi:MAG: hypothetical protein ABW051_06825 [Burkholderiaceae bacterium]